MDGLGSLRGRVESGVDRSHDRLDSRRLVVNRRARDWRRDLRPGYVIVWAGLIVVLMAVVVARLHLSDARPAVTVTYGDGNVRTIDLDAMQDLPIQEGPSTYQNQYGNWRDAGVYTGVLLTDLIGGVPFDTVYVVGEDGYRVEIEPERVENQEFRMILAYAKDGRAVPAWEDGFRLAVLADDGTVGNAEYGAVSAGSYWVKNVERIELQ